MFDELPIMIYNCDIDHESFTDAQQQSKTN